MNEKSKIDTMQTKLIRQNMIIRQIILDKLRGDKQKKQERISYFHAFNKKTKKLNEDHICLKN